MKTAPIYEKTSHIYDCNEVYNEILRFIDITHAAHDVAFMEAYTTFMEETEGMDDRLFTEKHQATVGEALRIFIASIITTLQHIKDTIKTEIEQRVFSAEYKKKIEQLKNDVLNAEKSGKKTVEIVDIRRATETYEQMVDTLCNKAKKISAVDYFTAKGLDNDIDDFYDVAEKYDDMLEDIMTKPVTMNTKDAIDLVETEIRNGRLLRSLDRAMREFKEMESNVKKIETKEAIIGRDLITKKVVIVRRSSNRLVKMIRKWVARIVAKCVFYFA